MLNFIATFSAKQLLRSQYKHVIMEFSSSNLEIKLNPEFGSNCLQFTFIGKFTTDASILGSKKWDEEFKANPSKSYCLVWDCSQMTGFEPSARREWYRCMTLYKSRISEVIVIANSILIRGAARVMLNFFGLEARIFRSFDEFKTAA